MPAHELLRAGSHLLISPVTCCCSQTHGTPGNPERTPREPLPNPPPQNPCKPLKECYSYIELSLYLNLNHLREHLCRDDLLGPDRFAAGLILRITSAHLSKVHGLLSREKQHVLKHTQVSSWQESCQSPHTNSERPHTTGEKRSPNSRSAHSLHAAKNLKAVQATTSFTAKKYPE
jgi:hypothetical protein